MQYTTNYQFRKPVRGVDEALIDDLNYNADKYDALINASQNSICAPYDENETYNTGDCAMHDGLLYECQNDGVTGAWDADDWERTTAAEHGTGGSNVEANPQGTPTDDLDTIGINGTIYNIAGSGGGNVYGAFVDTNRVIKATTAVPANTDVSYTATEDCVVVWALIASQNGVYSVKVDGVDIASSWNQTGAKSNQDTIYLKAGQTVTMRQSYGDADGGYTVYGLTFGTQNIFTPQIYSTEERCVGVWIDNKPLYQKTISIDSLNYTTPNSEKVIASLTGVDEFAYARGMMTNSSKTRKYIVPYINTSFTGTASIFYKKDTGEVIFTANESWSTAGIILTLLYTKTTDTAGSGSYNTLGVPARHYDTTEKVVGTVEMDNGTIKPLYEKSWWLTIPNQSGGYTFPNTSMADLDQVISNEYSFNGRGMRSYTYWYAGASIVFDEHTSSGISFYFGSSDYSGRMIFYTARYTKTTD